MARRCTVSKQAAKEEDTRPIRWRRYPYLFLIVCEDEKTEPYYFGKFIKLFPEETSCNFVNHFAQLRDQMFQ